MLYLIPILVFLGLIIGWFIGKYTKEEIKDGRKYLFILKKLVILLIIIAVIYNGLTWNLYSGLAVLLGILISWFLFRKAYFYLGLLMALSLLINNTFILIISSLVFIYGLVKGSYIIKNKFLFYNLILFFLPFILLFNANLLEQSYWLLAFLLGALVSFLLGKDL